MTRPFIINGLDLEKGGRILLVAPPDLDGYDLDEIAKGLHTVFPDVKFYLLGGGFQVMALEDRVNVGEIDG